MNVGHREYFIHYTVLPESKGFQTASTYEYKLVSIVEGFPTLSTYSSKDNSFIGSSLMNLPIFSSCRTFSHLLVFLISAGYCPFVRELLNQSKQDGQLSGDLVMNRRIWPLIWSGLVLLGLVGMVLSYTEAKFIPSGEGNTRITHLFFDSVPWTVWVAAALGFMVSARTRRTRSFIEDDRVLRHDGGFMLGHWTVALSCVMLLITGFALGLFIVPRAFPESRWSAFNMNLHFIASLYFVFGFFYWVGNMIVTPKELTESLPDKGSLREAVLHYAHIFGLTKNKVEARKYHGSERLAFPIAALTALGIVVSGFFKVAARFLVMPEQVTYGMTLVHDVFTVLMLFFLLAHVTLGAVVPWAWPLLRSSLTGYVSRAYAEKEHRGWVKELEGGEKHG